MRGTRRQLTAAGLGLAILAFCAPAGAEDLGHLFGPRYSSETYGGIHFEDRIGGGRFDLGVYALRHRQEMQQRDLKKHEPYSLRYRDPAISRERAAWPYGEPRFRNAPPYEVDNSACHAADSVGLGADGNRHVLSHDRCRPVLGEPAAATGGERQQEFR
jgi:hypothetical protein